MNAKNILRTNEWVQANRKRLETGEYGSQQKAAAAATKDLGFKVSTNVLRDLMQENGLPTRRISQRDKEKRAMEKEIELLGAENKSLKQTLAKVAAADFIPEDFKEYILAGLDEEIRTAISSN